MDDITTEFYFTFWYDEPLLQAAYISSPIETGQTYSVSERFTYGIIHMYLNYPLH